MIFFFGCLIFILWSMLSMISHGLSYDVCGKILWLFPQTFHSSILKIQNGFFYDVPNIAMPSEVFLVIYSLIFIMYFSVVLRIIYKENTKNFFMPILGFALLFRIVLIPSVLIHENDIYRYIWDGKVSIEGINPYKYAPEEANIITASPGSERLKDLRKLRTLRKEKPVFFDRIGYKEVSTIYPPVSEAVFALSNLIKRNSIVFMKAIFVLFDVGTILIIYKMLGLLGLNQNSVIIYAWSPLVIKEIANAGHLDAIVIFFMMLSLLCYVKKKKILTGGFLSLSVLSKYFPVIFLPFYIRRKEYKSILLFSVLTISAIVPFFIWGKTGAAQYFSGLFTYSREWAINSGMFEVLYAILKMISIDNPYYIVKFILGFSYLFVLGVMLRKNTEGDLSFIKVSFFAVAWLFFLSPVGDPWYFCWVIPFLCFFPKISLISFSWFLIFHYLTFTRDLGVFTLFNFSINNLILLQYIPFLLIFVVEHYCNKEGRLSCLKITK